MRNVPITSREETVAIRSYRGHDDAAVRRLYRAGLLLGELDPRDTAADLDDIAAHYLGHAGSHFWVAEWRGQVVGTIAVADADGDAQTAEVRRLRVDAAWRSTPLPGKLLHTAMDYCRRQGYLKVVLDTHLDSDEARSLLEACGFMHARSRPGFGKLRLEFYTDLYHQPQACDKQSREEQPQRFAH